jgi:hypothetical protein
MARADRDPPGIRTSIRRYVALEHCSGGFANTDLDLQLKTHGIPKLIGIGLLARTCVESTVRFAAELGYEVTMVKDATASYSDEEMRAAIDINIPTTPVMGTTNRVVDSITIAAIRTGEATTSRDSVHHVTDVFSVLNRIRMNRNACGSARILSASYLGNLRRAGQI